MLERLEAEGAGKWKLVKVNVDENQELAQHFQVRSIPHVIAFADGQAVDQFIGVLPEGQLRQFLDKLVPDGAEAERRAAQSAWAEGNKAEAIELMKTALAIDPGYDEARLDLIQWLLAEQSHRRGARGRKAAFAEDDARHRRALQRAENANSTPPMPPPTCRPPTR